MILRLDDFPVPMRTVYTLQNELAQDPDWAELAQALTLNKAKPTMGLKGQYGLFASAAWWRSIQNGQMPLRTICGVIQRAYFAGQDSRGANNSIEVLTTTGTVEKMGIYVDNKADAKLFTVGRHVGIVYALDPLKQQPAKDGGINYSEVALEMAISLA